MEDLLRQIAANTTPKESMSIAVKGDKTEIITKNYEMALLGLETFYSFPNIDATINMIKWSPGGGTNWHEFKLPIVVYELSKMR